MTRSQKGVTLQSDCQKNADYLAPKPKDAELFLNFEHSDFDFISDFDIRIFIMLVSVVYPKLQRPK